jgi:hypothetical protein
LLGCFKDNTTDPDLRIKSVINATLMVIVN